jgi:hypothetical protein
MRDDQGASQPALERRLLGGSCDPRSGRGKGEQGEESGEVATHAGSILRKRFLVSQER